MAFNRPAQLSGIMLCVASLHAQSVTLRIHPHVGDTLYMKMDQKFEMSSEDGDVAKPGEAAKSMSAFMCIRTHAIVLSASSSGTELLSITDSVIVSPPSAASIPLFAQAKRGLEGRKVRLNIAPNGKISLADGPAGAESSSILGQIPSILPEQPVVVGETWTRDLRVPAGGVKGGTGPSRATFKVDSIGPDGAVVYLSMHGTFARDKMNGTIAGTMQIDRRLEWITDSRLALTSTSTVVSPTTNVPMHVRTKVTQWLRAVPKP